MDLDQMRPGNRDEPARALSSTPFHGWAPPQSHTILMGAAAAMMDGFLTGPAIWYRFLNSQSFGGECVWLAIPGSQAHNFAARGLGDKTSDSYQLW